MMEFLTAHHLLGLTIGLCAFLCFWSILEIFEQQDRVHKGWGPRNPRRTYYWDHDPKEKR